ncbi:Uncharacterized protein C15D4.13c [Tolypocladium ophioglossoides CBS 100239]|uniref:Uncharacterized protein C15D4.13c n=1 Tax=Tolypocladium ophioglossoides (strain CBS 100239) TaxID=1163406 RepID=A0A0L0NFM3_TOLOC|nr:Uncharacterized protein C15D4.13c [Tolypocladium ophioglossoides CBS 100239]
MSPKPAPTHFLCIPLAGPQLARSWASFRVDVTSPVSFGLPEDVVRPLGTLHLTLGVMSLKQDGVDKAVEVLKGLKPREVLAEVRASITVSPLTQRYDGKPAVNPSASSDEGLSVTIRGLHAMQAASKTSVLYAPPADAEGILYRFCEQLRQPFRDSGLMEDEGRPLLLHATVVNTIYVKGGGGRGRRRERLTIDARDVLSRYDDYVWAEDLPVAKVAICRMGAKKIEGSDGNEAYEVEAETEV